jgi:predicted phosphodiesterase
MDSVEINNIKFQYVSDIHLECHKDSVKIPNVHQIENLILAGDIGRIDTKSRKKKLTEFLQDCSNRWNKVIYVPGNHEFYGVSIIEGLIELRNICDKTGVIFLYNETVMIGNVKVIGTTLWSQISDHSMEYYINDFDKIKGLDTVLYNKHHSECKKFLLDATATTKIESAINNKCIVVTHHSPDRDITRIPSYKDLSEVFGTDILDEFSERNISYWIYGHSHRNRDLTKHKIKLVCNQMGYIQEKDCLEFDATKFIEILNLE